jgi:Ca2+-binding RTX toxin-like protein
LDDDDLTNNTASSGFTRASFTGLADGVHVLRVQAQSAGGVWGQIATSTFTVETRAPQTTITSKPPSFASSATATFEFSADEPATFECRIDGGSWLTCSSPWIRPGLTEGQHGVEIRATDLAGKTDTTPATWSWTVDTIAPTVIDLTGPGAVTAETGATFTFGADESPVTFECRLDGGGWTPCGTNETYTGLTDGSHLFEVRATDRAGNVGPVKDWAWTVVTDAPETEITSAPSGSVATTTASIEFTSPDLPVTFECSLDGAPFAPCVSPWEIAGLADGEHTAAVRAVKAGLLADPTPATATWTVDTQPPVVTITSGPSGTVGVGNTSFAFTANEPSSFECKLDDGGWAACSSPHGVGSPSGGSHVFAVRATDAAGNVGAPAQRTWTVDDVAPVVTITSGPDPLTTAVDATFAFTVDDPAATTSCSLDGAVFGPCTSPAGYASLSAGSHTFRVRATDTAGNPGAVASRTWTIDNVAPVVTITGSPTGTISATSATIVFTVSEPGTSNECRLDGGGWQTCSSPAAFPGLADGSHTVEVRATDPAGNVSETASRTWTVDTVPPIVTITAGPSGTVAQIDATFEFEVDDPTATTECRLDGGAWSPCSSPAAYTALASGEHTFAVRATDPAGNTGPAAERTWTIETVEPETTITTGPPSLTNSATATFAFTSNDPAATFECNLDGAGWVACISPLDQPGLADGPHELQVRAAAGGLTDPTPATWSWTVDTTAPVLTVSTKPSGTTTVAGSRFEFTVDDASATTECRVDGGPWAPCSSPFVPALADGQHTVDIRATDPAGNTSPVDSTTWTVDGDLPQVQITSGPTGTTTERAGEFTFMVDDPAATVECRFDLGVWVACTSPAAFSDFADGRHSFDVRATDSAGNTSAEGRIWFIDATAPVVTIVSGPAGWTVSRSAVIVFTVDDPAASLACTLDGAPYAPCASPISLTGLGDGEHTLSITATDALRNASAPAVRTWTVDATPPVVTITSGPSGIVSVDDVTFTFEADDPSDFRCRLDGGAWQACTSPVDYTDLAVGDHVFEVEATNRAGLVGAIVGREFTIEILGEPLLSVEVLAMLPGGTPAPVVQTGLGDDFAFRVTVTNSGPVAAEDTVLTVPLSSDVALVGALPAGCTTPDTDGPVTCDLGIVGAGLGEIVEIGVEARFACTVWGDSGDSTDAAPLLGTTGDDVICGGGGSDVIRGRGGNDVVWGYGNRVGNPAAGPSSVATGASVRYGPGDLGADATTPAVVAIAGTDGDDTITTGSGADTIRSEEGDDTVTSGGGADVVDAGDGNDTVETGSGGDDVSAGAGDDGVTSGDDDDEVDGGPGVDVLGGGLGVDTIDGGDGADTINGNDGNDVLRGGEGADAVAGAAGDDALFGDGGNDSLTGAAGNDAISGGDGDDTADGGTGNDTVAGDSGNDTLRGGDNVDELRGGDGNDAADGGAGDDSIFGEGGNDNLLFGAGGNDAISGGEGDDTADGGPGNDTVGGDGGNDTLRGGDNVDDLRGGDGNDAADGGAGDDAIFGEGGNDNLLAGAGGNDVISGGKGDDTADGGTGNDTVGGDGGNDTFRGGDGADEIRGGVGADEADGGAGNDTISGDVGEDALLGGLGADSISGGEGDDDLTGADGGDVIEGGNGDDVVDGGNQADTISGGDGADTISGGSGNDSIRGGGGVDDLDGSGGDDALNGDDGDDLIAGATGSDRIDGGDGDDTVLGDPGADDLWGGPGNDLISGGSGDDFVFGGSGDDLLGGGSGEDVVFGEDSSGDSAGQGNDEIYGGAEFSSTDTGRNWLYGNGGADQMYGGSRADFMFGSDGDDTMFGYDGADIMLGDDGADRLVAGNGADEIHGGTANAAQSLDCGAGNDLWSFGPPAFETRDASCELRGGGTTFEPSRVPGWPRAAGPKP